MSILGQYRRMSAPIIMSESVLQIHYVFALLRKVHLSALKNKLTPGTENTLSITDELAACTWTCLMLAYSPKVPATTITADTNDDLAIFPRYAASFPRKPSPRYPLFHNDLFLLSVTSSENVSTTNMTSYADYNSHPRTRIIYFVLRKNKITRDAANFVN